MPSAVRRFGALVPSVLALLLLLPGPLACQDAEGDVDDPAAGEVAAEQETEAAPRQEMAADPDAGTESPLFSEKAREVIDESGPDEALSELSMLMGTARDDYVMDVDGLIALGQEYQADRRLDAAVTATQIATFVDPESVDAVVAMGDLYRAQENPTMAAMHYQQALGMDAEHPGAQAGMEATGDAMHAMPEMPERAADAEPEPEPEDETEEEMGIEERRFEAMHEGPSRDDLDRFKGRYESENGRSYWVMETCVDSGYLMVVPYADVQSWVLLSESDLEFVQSNHLDSEEPARFTFEAVPGGQATDLTIRMFLRPAPGQ